MHKTTFVTAHQAALLGLHPRIACDQALAGVFEGAHESRTLLLCGAALGRFPLARLEPDGAFKAPGVGLELAPRLQFNENLACGRDTARSLPVADGALVATNPVRSLLLCATEISNKFRVGHDGIMALAIWLLP